MAVASQSRTLVGQEEIPGKKIWLYVRRYVSTYVSTTQKYKVYT